MAEFPALPFFTDAYLADTRHLSTEEHGAYLLLLLCAWRTRGCSLPDDDAALARMVGVTRPKWRRLRPVMLDFFQVIDGRWVQARLQKTYRTVEAKVAKNRANGAKGGFAKAQKARVQNNGAQRGATKPLESKDEASANGDSDTHGETHSGSDSEDLPTKAKDQNQNSAEADLYDLPEAYVRIASTAGLDAYSIDFSPANAWLEAGRKTGKGRGRTPADLEKDILPTIARVHTREVERRGEAPSHLAYYTAAIEEARDVRLGLKIRSDTGGGTKAPSKPVPMESKRPFDHAAVEDWRVLLGDAKSRFQGDYMAQHWFIPDAHPVFRPANLGPNPAFDVNPAIPPEIYKIYGLRWRWLRAAEMASGSEAL